MIASMLHSTDVLSKEMVNGSDSGICMVCTLCRHVYLVSFPNNFLIESNDSAMILPRAGAIAVL